MNRIVSTIVLLILCIASLSALSALPHCAHARILNVPDDYQTIQAGIDEAEDGDTVLVAPGEYTENLNFLGKSIRVAGSPYNPAETVIDGNANGSVVRFDHGEDSSSVLSGFTLTNGSGSRDISGDMAGGGVHCSRSSPTIEHVVVAGNVAQFGGGIMVQMSSPVITNSYILDNQATRSGGGIYCSRDSTNVRVSYVVIARNSANVMDGGIGCYSSSRASFNNVYCLVKVFTLKQL